MNRNEEKAFGSFDNGFTLTFENGLVLSTRFGPGNYCDNHKMNVTSRIAMAGPAGLASGASDSRSNLFSDTVEVGVWDNAKPGSRCWVNGWQEVVFNVADADPYDDIRGYVTMPEWLQIVDWCRAWKPEQK